MPTEAESLLGTFIFKMKKFSQKKKKKIPLQTILAHNINFTASLYSDVCVRTKIGLGLVLLKLVFIPTC